MPIPVGGNVYQQPTLDLATPTYQQRALEQAQWQQAINQVLQSVTSAIKQTTLQKAEAKMPAEIDKIMKEGKYDISITKTPSLETGGYTTSYVLKTKDPLYTPEKIQNVAGAIQVGGVYNATTGMVDKFANREKAEVYIANNLGGNWKTNFPEVASVFEAKYPPKEDNEDKKGLDVGKALKMFIQGQPTSTPTSTPTPTGGFNINNLLRMLAPGSQLLMPQGSPAMPQTMPQAIPQVPQTPTMPQAMPAPNVSILRNRAIQELQKSGYPVTERNIQAVIQQLQGQ